MPESLAIAARCAAELRRLGVDSVRRRGGLSRRAAAIDAATLDRTTGRFAIVLEDLAALHGATHAKGAGAAWLGTNSTDPLLPLAAAAMGPLTRRVARHDQTTVPPASARLLRSYRRWAHLLDEGPQSVLHGDPHPGNVYLHGDRVGLLDWQAVRRGNPQRDATYFLVLSLPADVRRRHERDLLDHYRSELAGARGPVRTPEETWQDHRRMAAYAYVAAVFTFGLGGLQGADVADVGLRRAADAVADLETARILAD